MGQGYGEASPGSTTQPDAARGARRFGVSCRHHRRRIALAEISWLRRVRERKSLVCKPTLQKVSTTFWALSLVLLRLRRPVASGSVGAVGSATASPVFPVLADVPARVECSAAAPVPVRRPAADA